MGLGSVDWLMACLGGWGSINSSVGLGWAVLASRWAWVGRRRSEGMADGGWKGTALPVAQIVFAILLIISGGVRDIFFWGLAKWVCLEFSVWFYLLGSSSLWRWGMSTLLYISVI